MIENPLSLALLGETSLRIENNRSTNKSPANGEVQRFVPQLLLLRGFNVS
jgi:hypothetical protein